MAACRLAPSLARTVPPPSSERGVRPSPPRPKTIAPQPKISRAETCGSSILPAALEDKLARVPVGARAVLGSPATGTTLRLTNLGIQLLAASPAVHGRILAGEVGAALAAEACRAMGIEGPDGVGVAVEMGFGLLFGVAAGGFDVDVPRAFGLALLGTVLGRQLGRWGQQAAEAAGVPKSSASSPKELGKASRVPDKSPPRAGERTAKTRRGEQPELSAPGLPLPDFVALALTLAMIRLSSGAPRT